MNMIDFLTIFSIVFFPAKTLSLIKLMNFMNGTIIVRILCFSVKILFLFRVSIVVTIVYAYSIVCEIKITKSNQNSDIYLLSDLSRQNAYVFPLFSSTGYLVIHFFCIGQYKLRAAPSAR